MAECRICSGELELRVRGNGAAVTAAALSPSAHAVGRPRRPARLPRVRDGPAARAAVRRAAARPLPRDARRRVPGRGGRPARDREPAARPDRRARAARAAARRRLRPRPAARRGAQARLRDASGSSSRARRRGTRARRSASTCASCRWRRSARAATATRRASSTRSCSPTCSSTSTIRSPRSTAARGCCGPAACSASSRPIRPRSPRALAGARWWGYLPAHTVLLPRKTLRELISARGLVISDDVPFVRTFAAQALGRRARRAARAAERAAERRRGPDAAGHAQPLARRRARDPRPPHAGPARRASRCCSNGNGARRCTSSCRPTRPTRTIPDVVAEMPVERRRPRAADRRRVAGRDDARSRCARPRRAPPPREPRLRRVAEDRLRARAARRREGRS